MTEQEPKRSRLQQERRLPSHMSKTILNLSDEQRKNLSKTDLIEKILSDYIGKKVTKVKGVFFKGINFVFKQKKIFYNEKKLFLEHFFFSQTDFYQA